MSSHQRCLYRPSLLDSQIITTVNLIQLNTATGLTPIIHFIFWHPGLPLTLTPKTVRRLHHLTTYTTTKVLHGWPGHEVTNMATHLRTNACRVAVRRFNGLNEYYNHILQLASTQRTLRRTTAISWVWTVVISPEGQRSCWWRITYWTISVWQTAYKDWTRCVAVK